jgi:hypothetical protein
MCLRSTDLALSMALVVRGSCRTVKAINGRGHQQSTWLLKSEIRGRCGRTSRDTKVRGRNGREL